jgi:hypothetical protein
MDPHLHLSEMLDPDPYEISRIRNTDLRHWKNLATGKVMLLHKAVVLSKRKASSKWWFNIKLEVIFNEKKTYGKLLII